MVKQPSAPIIFDIARWRCRWSRYAIGGDSVGVADENFVFQLALADLKERLQLITRDFSHVAIFTPFPFTQKFPNIDHITFVGPLQADGFDKVIKDDEYWPFEENSLDLVIDLMGLGLVNNVQGMLMQIKQSLKADGLFLSGFLGENSLIELRHALLFAESLMQQGAAMRVHPMINLQQFGSLLQHAGFALPVVDIESYQLAYGGYDILLRELRRCGLANCLKDTKSHPLSTHIIKQAEKYHKEHYPHSDKEDKFMLSLDFIWGSGWKPHHSQQQPLAPGSAQISLKQVL